MIFVRTVLLALGISTIAASPLWKRQDTSVGTDAVPISGDATATSAATGTDSAAQTTAATDSALQSTATGSAAQTSVGTTLEPSAVTETEVPSSAESGLSSVASDATTATSSAPEPTSTSADNATSTEAYAFGCPDGYSLTYVLGVNTYPDVNITQAYDALEDWGTAIPPPIVVLNNTGEGEGATRSWEILNLTVSETLIDVTSNDTSGDLRQTWNLTGPVTAAPSVVISNATSDLTLYQNTTTNDTTVQFYVNFCVSDQQAGLELYAQLATTYLTGLNSLFTNSTPSAGNTTSVGSTQSGSSTESAVSSSAESSASSSATNGAETASSGLSSVASTAVAGATSVAGEATSGAGGALSSGISAASSVIGDITSVLRY